MADKITLTDLAKTRMLAWVRALESDEYTQAKHMLEFRESEGGPASQCCIGVLCRVAIANGLDVPVEAIDGMNNWGIRGFVTRFDDNMSAAPPSVLAWLLDHTDHMSYGTMLDQNTLIKMNDMEDKNFHKIAAYLREVYDLDG